MDQESEVARRLVEADKNLHALAEQVESWGSLAEERGASMEALREGAEALQTISSDIKAWVDSVRLEIQEIGKVRESLVVSLGSTNDLLDRSEGRATALDERIQSIVESVSRLEQSVEQVSSKAEGLSVGIQGIRTLVMVALIVSVLALGILVFTMLQ